MNNDVSDTVEHFAETYSFERPGAVSYANGLVVEAADTAGTIRAAIFQPTMADLMRLPEGDRAKVVWSIWTTTQIISGRQDDGRRGDRVQVRGAWYQVMSLSDRAEGGYYKGYLELYVDRGRSLPASQDVVA